MVGFVPTAASVTVAWLVVVEVAESVRDRIPVAVAVPENELVLRPA